MGKMTTLYIIEDQLPYEGNWTREIHDDFPHGQEEAVGNAHGWESVTPALCDGTPRHKEGETLSAEFLTRTALTA